MELYYTIKNSSDFKIAYEVTVFCGIKKGLLIEKDPLKRVISLEIIKSSTNLLEKNLFSLLIKEKRSSLDYSHFAVSKENGKKLLQALTMTCRFVMQGSLSAVHFDNKEAFKIIQKGSKLHLFLGSEPVSAQDLFFVPDLCLIKNKEIYHYQLQLSKRLASKLDVLLSQDEIKEVVDDYQDEVRFELEKTGSFEVNLSPVPCLKLKDRTGAFANLAFFYGDQLVFSTDRVSKIKRNFEEEKLWEEDLLKTGFVKKIVTNTNYYCGLDKVAKSLSALIDCGWEIFDTYERRIVKGNPQNLSFELQGERVHLNGKINFLNNSVDIKEIHGAFCRRQSFMDLGGNQVGLIDSSLFSFDGEIEIDQEESGISFHKAAFFQFKDNFKEASYDPALSALKKGALIAEKDRLDLPNFQGVLFPYQKKGVSWMLSLFQHGLHGLLADDMGLGKTIQIIAFLSGVEFSRALIIVPTTLIFQWKKEFSKFYPEVNVQIYHGKNKQLNFDHDKTVVITAYGTIREHIKEFKKLDFDILILDEAQVIKNRNSQIFEAVCQIKAGFRLSMTGTPIENSVLDLISHYEFLIPGLINKEALTQVDLDLFTKKKIKNLIDPYFLRRKKQDVLKELPEKIEQTVFVNMEDDERDSYENTLKEIRGNMKEFNVLEAILRLRQHCCIPTIANPQFSEEGAKFKQVLSDILDIISSNQKVILYSSFVSVLEHFKASLRSLGIEPLYLDGSTTERHQLVEEFQNDKDKKVFLISLKAGGVGLNLTAADYVLVYDPWWNEAAENQAIDRAHRVGREGAVVARRYLVCESIEEKILNLKKHKSALQQELIEDSIKEDFLKDLII